MRKIAASSLTLHRQCDLMGGDRAFAQNHPRVLTAAQVDDGSCHATGRGSAVNDQWNLVAELFAHAACPRALRQPTQIGARRCNRQAQLSHDRAADWGLRYTQCDVPRARRHAQRELATGTNDDGERPRPEAFCEPVEATVNAPRQVIGLRHIGDQQRERLVPCAGLQVVDTVDRAEVYRIHRETIEGIGWKCYHLAHIQRLGHAADVLRLRFIWMYAYDFSVQRVPVSLPKHSIAPWRAALPDEPWVHLERMPDAPAMITSRSNLRVKELRAAVSGKATTNGDLLGIEGLQLIGELHKSGGVFETIYVREGSEAAMEVGWPSRLRAGQTMRLSRAAFDSAVTTATPQGIAATWKIREPVAAEAISGCLLLLENLQDPGNLGTLLRSAEAFGITAVLTTHATVNQWNPKVVRSSAGSVFRLPVVRATLEKHINHLRANGVRTFAAVSSFPGAEHEGPSPTMSLAYDAKLVEPCALLIGNEGGGLSDAARKLADEQVRIPCATESLNAAVAGSVLMYEVMRQRDQRDQQPRKGEAS